jgi:hypothetical protein
LITTETCRDVECIYCDVNNIIEVETVFDCVVKILSHCHGDKEKINSAFSSVMFFVECQHHYCMEGVEYSVDLSMLL